MKRYMSYLLYICKHKWYDNNQANMILHNLTRTNIESKIRRYAHENE